MFRRGGAAVASRPESALATALEQFDRAAEYIHLDADLRERLRVPEREIAVQFPVVMDDGTTRVFAGCRVQHNLSRGPGQGGHPLPPGSGDG